MVLTARVAPPHIGRHIWLIENTAEIQALGFPMGDTFAGVKQIGSPHQFIKSRNAQLRHDAAHFFCDKEEIVHHMLRLAGEFFAQSFILCSNAYGAGIEMAFAHHDAAFNHQR